MMDKTASKKEIGNFIKARMLEKGLATRDLAESAGVSEAAVRRWFRGETQPDTVKLPFVAKALDVTTDEIIGAKKLSMEYTAESRLGSKIVSLGGRTGAVMCMIVGVMMASEVLYGLCSVSMLVGSGMAQLPGYMPWLIMTAFWAVGGVYLMISGFKALKKLDSTESA